MFSTKRKIQKSSIIKSVFSVTGIVALAKILAFAKQMLIAATYGTTIETDIIALSHNLIGDFEYLLVQVFITAFIPIYLNVRKRGSDVADSFVTNSLIISSILAFVVLMCMVIFAPVVSRVIAPSYNSEYHYRLSQCIRIFAPTLWFMVICAVLNALLRAHKEFVPGETISLVQSIIIMLMVLGAGKMLGIDALMVSYILYPGISVVIMAFLARKYWTFRRIKPLVDKNVRLLLKMCGPLLLGYAVVFVNQQVDKIIVSGMREGAISALDYSSVLVNLVMTLVGAICSVVFSYVTSMTVENNHEKAGEIVYLVTIILSTILVPITTLTVWNAESIVSIVYGRGAFGVDSVFYTSVALKGYAFSIVFFLYRELYARLQYSYYDTKRPMLNSSISILINIVLSILLSRPFGVMGVTAASSISMLICAILNVNSAKKHNKYVKLVRGIRIIPYWLAGIGISSLISYIGNTQFVTCGVLERLVLITGGSFFLYFAIGIPFLKREYIKIRELI